MPLLTADDPDTLLRVLDGRADGLVHVEHLARRPARFATLAEPLPDRLAGHLPPEGLWTHQAAAIDRARAGTHVAVATGTASGKSLCFQLPIAEAVTEPVRGGTALMVGPTKALAQDQLRALGALGVEGLVACTYDGDSSPEQRTWARAHADVLLTNPEMLHCGLLPHHERWATFLHRLRYVVVDELHTFRGVFGSHVAHVLRRLRRLCLRYGSEPTFVFASATIGEPATLASALCGSPVEAITDDGSPCGERTFALWNPPLVDAGSGARVSTHRVTASLLAELVDAGHRTIAFCRSRRGTEVVAADAQSRLGPGGAEAVRPYRGGYLASERREIEAELFGGRLRGVVATSALELGVDVGGLDACVLDGFPGTIASLWQQAGRAGRSQQRSLAVLVAGDDALDQWLMAHPDEVFSRSPEPAVVNPANPYVFDAHLACAAYELPLSAADERWWGDDLDEGVRRLVHGDRLRIRSGARMRQVPGDGPRAVWSGRGFPSRGVGLRSGGGREVRIARADGALVGTVDEGRAPEVVHPGAVYLHQGVAWRVTDLDLDAGIADGGAHRRGRGHPGPLDGPHLRARGGAHPAGGPRPAVARERGGHLPGHRLPAPRRGVAARCWAPTTSTCPPHRWSPGPSGTRSTPACCAGPGWPPRRGPAPCTRPSTPPSACCRCSPSATAGTWAACPPRGPRTGRADDLHLRRLPRRGRHRRARLRGRRPPPGRHAETLSALPVRRRLPQLRAVAQVRQPQRAARQGGRHRPAGGDPPRSSRARRLTQRSTRMAAVARTVTSGSSGPTRATCVGDGQVTVTRRTAPTSSGRATTLRHPERPASTTAPSATPGLPSTATARAASRAAWTTTTWSATTTPAWTTISRPTSTRGRARASSTVA